ncbi:toxin-antitoxin system TumE family protein [Spirosoma rhododendri]|uniref:Uncharacterized protein n=1 Tax=Spirosoma rhododendri TaxID=2728024 RepID=A0A7L5DTL4_9BACT|nr:DUF6516 family protein [Spirosoma rhododendri]QJD80791.1 hypothetical protein HH216_21985 [Spirosoma rhododendri]
MEAAIEPYPDLISSWIITAQEENSVVSFRKARILFRNGSSLSIFEKLHKPDNHYRYGYQWQTADNVLIHRWDNALHYEQIETFPFHQHVGSEENVQPSKPMTLADVLTIIAQRITSG